MNKNVTVEEDSNCVPIYSYTSEICLMLLQKRSPAKMGPDLMKA
jgi:hypothetical protein